MNATAFDHAPDCCTRADPLLALVPTIATIYVLPQLTTVALAVPSQTVPVPCVAPKPYQLWSPAFPAISTTGAKRRWRQSESCRPCPWWMSGCSHQANTESMLRLS